MAVSEILPITSGRKGVGNRYVVSWAARGDEASIPSESRTVPDTDTMPNFVYVRVCAGEPMPGVFLVSNRMPKDQAVEELF